MEQPPQLIGHDRHQLAVQELVYANQQTALPILGDAHSCSWRTTLFIKAPWVSSYNLKISKRTWSEAIYGPGLGMSPASTRLRVSVHVVLKDISNCYASGNIVMSDLSEAPVKMTPLRKASQKTSSADRYLSSTPDNQSLVTVVWPSRAITVA